MRTPAVLAVLARTAAIALAVAAVAILAFTALADHHHGGGTPAAPATRPVPSVPASTLPGSVDVPGTVSSTPRVPADHAKTWLRALTGTWTLGSQHNYFRFHADGTGEWNAYGQRLWSGRATPRDATTFDLSDPSGQGAAYWRVKLVSGGKRLLFAGTQETYTKS